MPRPRHPKKDIEKAIAYAEAHGWRIVHGGAHAWGQMYCPWNDRNCRCHEFCRTSIASTPKNPGDHAMDLKRIVKNCVHTEVEG
ncbi:MAG: hypothetical protein Q8L20_15320 [Gammaproteobacteria bacterium]|nr:hypothetical protein [Gammaproteobacteria bacterium]